MQLRIPGLFPWKKKPVKKVKTTNLKVHCKRCNKKVTLPCKDKMQEENCSNAKLKRYEKNY